MKSSSEYARVGAILAYGAVVLAFAMSAYAMNDSIQTTNNTLDEVGRMLKEMESYPTGQRF